MSVTRFSEAVGYVPDLNGCRKKIVEYCRDSENTIDRLVEENAELREFAKYCQGFLGCEETRDSMALHGITIKAKELLNK